MIVVYSTPTDNKQPLIIIGVEMNTIFSLVFVMLAACVCTCSISAVNSQWTFTIYVDPYNGNDTESCTTNGSTSIHDACATLEYAMNKLKSSTQVVLVSGIHSMNWKILSISNCQHIEIIFTAHNIVNVREMMNFYLYLL